MNTSTLDELLSNVTQNTPYDKSLKVLVLACDNVRTYTSDQGEVRQYLYAAVGDRTRAAKVIIYDNTKFGRFVEGKSVVIRNFIKKPSAIVVTNNTRIFPSQDVTVPEDVRTEGINIIRPPDAPFQPLDQAMLSPSKSKVSVKGKIIQEEAVQEVTVRNDKVHVKSIYIKDSTLSKAKVSLWRDLTISDTRIGDFVSITNVIVNNYRNETSLSTTYQSTIQAVDAPEECKELNCIGASVDNGNIAFLLHDDTEISTQLNVVQAALPDVQNIEEHIMRMCNPIMKLKCTFRGTDLVDVEFLHDI